VQAGLNLWKGERQISDYLSKGNLKLVIGCDEAAFDMKEEIKKLLLEKGHEVEDVGVYDKTPVLYPDVAVKGATKVANGEAERGILICGTGIGMAITANKVPGIRAAVCHDSYSTERSVLSNNAQVMCMGARVIGVELAKMLVDMWLGLEFVDGRSTDKIERISYYENELKK